jgi:hypothetical protein
MPNKLVKLILNESGFNYSPVYGGSDDFSDKSIIVLGAVLKSVSGSYRHAITREKIDMQNVKSAEIINSGHNLNISNFYNDNRYIRSMLDNINNQSSKGDKVLVKIDLFDGRNMLAFMHLYAVNILNKNLCLIGGVKGIERIDIDSMYKRISKRIVIHTIWVTGLLLLFTLLDNI